MEFKEDITKLSIPKLRKIKKYSTEKRWKAKEELTYAKWDCIYNIVSDEIKLRYERSKTTPYKNLPKYLRLKLMELK